MDNLPPWALWIITAIVGIGPGLAILSARSIARLLHRVLWPRPEVASKPGREPSHGEPAGWQPANRWRRAHRRPIRAGRVSASRTRP